MILASGEEIILRPEIYRNSISVCLKNIHEAACELRDNYEPDPKTDTAIRLNLLIEAIEEAAMQNDAMYGTWTRK